MQIARWGDGLAVRLPDEVVEKLALKEGDELDIRVAGAHAVSVELKIDREEIINRLRALRGSLPADFKFDRDEANAR